MFCTGKEKAKGWNNLQNEENFTNYWAHRENGTRTTTTKRHMKIKGHIKMENWNE